MENSPKSFGFEVHVDVSLKKIHNNINNMQYFFLYCPIKAANFVCLKEMEHDPAALPLSPNMPSAWVLSAENFSQEYV